MRKDFLTDRWQLIADRFIKKEPVPRFNNLILVLKHLADEKHFEQGTGHIKGMNFRNNISK